MVIARFTIALAGLTLLCVCQPSAAEIIRFKLTGKVAVNVSVFNVLPEDLVAGADTNVLEAPDFDAPGGKRFVAYWSYDTSIPDARPELPYSGVYPHPLTDPLMSDFGLSLKIDEYDFRLDTLSEPYTVQVGVGGLLPNCSFGCGDGIGTESAYTIVPFEFNSPTMIHTPRMSLNIGESLLSTVADSNLPSDALPTGVDLSEFDFAFIQISGSGTVGVGATPPPAFLIKAWIDDIILVPEPTSWINTLLVSILLPNWRFRFYGSQHLLRRTREVSQIPQGT